MNDEKISLRNEVIEELRKLGQESGDPYFFIDLVRTYLGTAEVSIEKLKVYCAFRDTDLVRKTAHALKSSSGNMGASGMYELCLALEKMGESANLDNTDAMIWQLEQEFHSVQAALRLEIARATDS